MSGNKESITCGKNALGVEVLCKRLTELPGSTVRREDQAMAIEVQGVAPLVQVFDMPRSIHFYRDLLGFRLTGKSKEKSGDPDDVDWAMLQLSNATIMLNTAYDPEDVPLQPNAGRWSGHQDTCLYFGCPDLEGTYQQLVSKGLQLDPPKIAWYGMKQLRLQDPDGFGICFQWFV